MHIHTHTHKYTLYIYAYTNIYIYSHIHVCIYIYKYTRVKKNTVIQQEKQKFLIKVLDIYIYMYIFTKANNGCKKTCNIRIPRTRRPQANEHQCTIKQRLFTEHIQLSKMTTFVVQEKKPKTKHAHHTLFHLKYLLSHVLKIHKRIYKGRPFWLDVLVQLATAQRHTGKEERLGLFFSFFCDSMAKYSGQGTDADLKPLPGGTKGTT